MGSNSFQIENRVPAGQFLLELAGSSPEFFFLAAYFTRVEQPLGRYFLNFLEREAHELETSLDNAEVFTNELFFFREVVAGIRWFCQAALTLEEGVISRYRTRRLKDSAAEEKALLEESRVTLDYLYRTIDNLCRQALETAAVYRVKPPQKSRVDSYIKFQGRRLLEKNRVASAPQTADDAIEVIATDFLSVSEFLRQYTRDLDRKRVRINEKDTNRVLNGLHTLQSFYDSHIHDTFNDAQAGDFWSLRGYIGISLRLTHLVYCLSHYYERHLLTSGDEAIRQPLATLVDETALKTHITDYGLRQAARYISGGAALAMSLLTRYTGRVRRTIKIPVGVDGIHARPMTWMHHVSRKHGHVVFEVGGEKFEADSMLSLLTMAEGIDRAIGLEDRDSQIAVATGTVINELEKHEKPILANGKVYRPDSLMSALEAFRADLRRKAGTRYVKVIATGPATGLDHIEAMAACHFRKEEFPPDLLAYLPD